MKIYYCFDPKWVLDQNIFLTYEKLLKDAGVTDLWLMGYFNGQFARPLSEIAAAKTILDQHGWSTGAINIPVGHPGALDPDHPSLIFDIPKTWRYRIETTGKAMKFCGDITPNMIQDNHNAIQQLATLGFTQVFLDDDCRMGNWGPQIRGCFCDHCIQEFNTQFNVHMTRESLVREIKSKRNRTLLQHWVQYNCGKINQLLQGLHVPEVDICLMVMHNGDERHGIDLGAIRTAHPTMGIRVGEAHFNDREFGQVKGRIEEVSGILMHLNQSDIQNTYSETTIFPANALSPENWVLKAQYALALGIPNLFLMGGVWLIEPPYWEYFKQRLPELQALATLQEKGSPIWPVHVATGSYLDAFDPPFSLLLNGIPANPVRSSHLKRVCGADILVMIGDFRLDEEWQPYLPNYKQIICDSKTYRKNRNFIQTLPMDVQNKIHVIKSSIPLLGKMKSRHERELICQIRTYLKDQVKFPFIMDGTNVMLILTADKTRVIVCNLETVRNNCHLYFQGRESEIILTPNEVRIIAIEKF